MGSNNNIISSYFSLTLDQNFNNTVIVLKMCQDEISTCHWPATYFILKTHLPNIFKSYCQNGKRLPFSKEVRKTEMGHLFEHIILTYLCKYKIERGFKEADYEGLTSWNWKIDPVGTFYITISCTKGDSDIFNLALEKSIKLFIKIINSKCS